MRSKWILTLLGVAAVVTGSRGQGTVSFLNYNSEAPPTVNYSSDPALVPAGKAGLALGGSFAAELAWFNGVTADPNQLALVPASLTYFSFGGPGPNSTPDGDLPDGAGWYIGPAALPLPGAPSGSIVTLEVYAFNGGSLGAASVAGNSGLFQVTLGGGALPPASLISSPNFTVQNVPEPSIFALAGLAAACLMTLRRKRA